MLLKRADDSLINDGTDITHPDLRGMEMSGESPHYYIEGWT